MDEMVVKLGVEQEDDDAQKKWCESEFDTTEDESGCKQVLSRRLRNQTSSSDHIAISHQLSMFVRRPGILENFSLVVRSKDTSRLIKGLTTKIEETEEAIKTVTAEIAESALERPKLTLAENRKYKTNCKNYSNQE